MGPAVRTWFVRHPFPYAGTIQFRFEGCQFSGPLPGHPQRKLYTQCLYNIGYALTRGNARPFDHFFLLFAPQDSRTISDDFKVICRGVFCPSSCSSINSIAASAIAS